MDLGITYCESARAYAGSESHYGATLRHLHETLTNMKTDHLDLWQVHDVREDVEMRRPAAMPDSRLPVSRPLNS